MTALDGIMLIGWSTALIIEILAPVRGHARLFRMRRSRSFILAAGGIGFSCGLL